MWEPQFLQTFSVHTTVLIKLFYGNVRHCNEKEIRWSLGVPTDSLLTFILDHAEIKIIFFLSGSEIPSWSKSLFPGKFMCIIWSFVGLNIIILTWNLTFLPRCEPHGDWFQHRFDARKKSGNGLFFQHADKARMLFKILQSQ
jgi:hypothetical protein